VFEGKSRRKNERVPCLNGALQNISFLRGSGISASQDPAGFWAGWSPDLLVPGQAQSKNCPFSSTRRDFFLPPLGSWTSRPNYPPKMGHNRQIPTRKVRQWLQPSYSRVSIKKAQFAHSRISTTQITAFFVGAGGFEPPASWSRTLPESCNAAIFGQFSKFELHEVHRISQTVHNLRTLTGEPANLLARGEICGPISASCIAGLLHISAIFIDVQRSKSNLHVSTNSPALIR
jgi:hypothetical protein